MTTNTKFFDVVFILYPVIGSFSDLSDFIALVECSVYLRRSVLANRKTTKDCLAKWIRGGIDRLLETANKQNEHAITFEDILYMLKKNNYSFLGGSFISNAMHITTIPLHDNGLKRRLYLKKCPKSIQTNTVIIEIFVPIYTVHADSLKKNGVVTVFFIFLFFNFFSIFFFIFFSFFFVILFFDR